MTGGAQLGTLPQANVSRLNVLVSGSTGFVGASVTKQLLDDGCNVYAVVRDPNKLAALLGKIRYDRLTTLQCDLLVDHDLRKLEDVLLDNVGKLDVIVHTVGGGPLTSNDKFAPAINALNYQTTVNLLSTLKKTEKLSSRSLVLYFSSLAAMGVPSSRENKIIYEETTSCDPILPYEKSKLRTEDFLRRFTIESNVKTVIFRFPQIYGSNDDALMQMIHLIRKKVFPVVRGRSGSLPLIHVEDAAKAARTVVKHVDEVKEQFNVYLLCERSYSYRQVAELVKDRYGTGGVLSLPNLFLYPATLIIEYTFKVFGKPEPMNRHRLRSIGTSEFLTLQGS